MVLDFFSFFLTLFDFFLFCLTLSVPGKLKNSIFWDSNNFTILISVTREPQLQSLSIWISIESLSNIF